MTRWFALALLLLLAAPLAAQDDDDEELFGEGWHVGGPADAAYQQLSRGEDRTGYTLEARVSTGFDSNIFFEDRGEDGNFFMDAVAHAHFGLELGMARAGVRGLLAGRVYPGEVDATLWDMTLGGFADVPVDGGLGYGVTGDAIYRQLAWYEIRGPITRADDLRMVGVSTRAWIGYAVTEWVVLEMGATFVIDDYTEEKRLDSLDSWEIKADFGVRLDLRLVKLRPYVSLDYESFREQVDFKANGIPKKSDLDLIKFDIGAAFDLHIWKLESHGNVYIKRQDDSSSGFDRYMQYGVRGVADLDLDEKYILRAGFDIWTREYEDRVDPGTVGASTVFERNLSIHLDLGYNFWEFFNAGIRWQWDRRTSDLDNQGYSNTQVSVFLEIDFGGGEGH